MQYQLQWFSLLLATYREATWRVATSKLGAIKWYFYEGSRYHNLLADITPAPI